MVPYRGMDHPHQEGLQRCGETRGRGLGRDAPSIRITVPHPLPPLHHHTLLAILTPHLPIGLQLFNLAMSASHECFRNIEINGVPKKVCLLAWCMHFQVGPDPP